jgi:hypothetical protein
MRAKARGSSSAVLHEAPSTHVRLCCASLLTSDKVVAVTKSPKCHTWKSKNKTKKKKKKIWFTQLKLPQRALYPPWRHTRRRSTWQLKPLRATSRQRAYHNHLLILKHQVSLFLPQHLLQSKMLDSSLSPPQLPFKSWLLSQPSSCLTWLSMFVHRLHFFHPPARGVLIS